MSRTNPSRREVLGSVVLGSAAAAGGMLAASPATADDDWERALEHLKRAEDALNDARPRRDGHRYRDRAMKLIQEAADQVRKARRASR